MTALSVTARGKLEPSPGISPFTTPTSSSITSPSAASSPPSSASTPKATNVPVSRSNLSIRPSAFAIHPSTALPTPPAPAPAPPAGNARINKMSMASVMSPEPAPTATPSPVAPPQLSMTTKEWVVPPRPKPGRKPATDTPPTKRKAQNRAAQRAFRERRAARVGELEEQIEEQREEREKTERGLRDRIRTLELELQSFRSKCSVLENLLDRERQERNRSQADAEGLRHRHDSISYGTSHSRGGSLPSIPDAQRFVENGNMQFNQPQQTIQAFPISQIISPPDPAEGLSEADLTCGNCQPTGPCACAEEAMRSVQEAGCGNCDFGGNCDCIETTLKGVLPPQQSKRGSSPSGARSPGKRLKPAPPPHQLETDFSSDFNRGKPSVSTPLSTHTPSQPPPRVSPRVAQKESCGFCEDGTYCVCAEAALSSSSMPTTTSSANSIPSIFSQETQAPSPPAEPDSMPTPMEITPTGAVKLRRLQQGRKPVNKPSAPSNCGPNGPGTCQQCLDDPQSGLFCRTLAAINGPGNGGCCGGRSAGGGCCKSKPAGHGASKARPIAISCADTYKTLSSHRGFDRAFEDLGTWLPKLKVLPPLEEEPLPAGRPAVEIDAASIMSTLKFWDVRFGSSRD